MNPTTPPLPPSELSTLTTRVFAVYCSDIFAPCVVVLEPSLPVYMMKSRPLLKLSRGEKVSFFAHNVANIEAVFDTRLTAVDIPFVRSGQDVNRFASLNDLEAVRDAVTREGVCERV